MIRLTVHAQPPSVNRKGSGDKLLREAWRAQLREEVCQRLNPELRYTFRYCVIGKFENRDGELSKRDHFNLEKPLIDDVCKCLHIDDKQIVHVEGWKVHREGEERIEIQIEECHERTPRWL